MHIEYLGIPGSGKTFWKNKYLEQLQTDGKKFLDLSRHKDMPFWLKVFYKIAETILMQLPKYKRQTKNYEQVCKGCKSEPKYLSYSLAYCIKDIVLASLLHDIFNGKKIYINDEGQLHRLVFLSVQFGVSIDLLMPIYMQYCGNVKSIYVKTEVETAFANIRKRNRHVCPMDELSDKTLREYESAYYESCERLTDFLTDNFVKKEI